MRVKNRLKERRKLLGMSQEYVARKSSISFKTYVRIERSRTTPNLDTALKIAKALRTSVNKLFALPSSRYRE